MCVDSVFIQAVKPELLCLTGILMLAFVLDSNQTAVCSHLAIATIALPKTETLGQGNMSISASNFKIADLSGELSQPCSNG